MKASIIRGVLILAAGAGCATVVAQDVWVPRPVPAVELDLRLNRAALELVEIGRRIRVVQKDRIEFWDGECVPPGDPDIWEELRIGNSAVAAFMEAQMEGREVGLIPVPCKPR